MYQPAPAVQSENRIELGPESLLWRWAGDNRIAFMGGTIGLLQLLHPAIGAGVLEHSNFFADPSDRVFRSLPEILGVVYDGDASATGRTVRDFHRTIKGMDATGQRYHALEPLTFWWAHATFQFMVEQVADRWDAHDLSGSERARLYAEGVEWYRRYGVSDRGVPVDRAAFQVEWDRVCREVLEMNDAAAFVLELLDSPVLAPLGRAPSLPVWLKPLADSWGVRRLSSRPSRLAAIGGLPPIVRERFDIPWSPRDQRELRVIEVAVRRGWRFVPDALRWQPRALAGWRRSRRQATAA